MKPLLRLGLLLISVLSGMQANAGDARGNGGHGVVCRSATGTVSSVELLDFYEAREFRGIQYNLGGTNLSVEEKINLALDRLNQFEDRGKEYLAKANAFYKNALFKSGITLVSVSDTEHLAFPEGCRVEQIVNQRKPQFPEDKLYLVNKNLWDLMDKDNKAGLILHEVIYSEFLESGHTNSAATRYYNAYLASNKMSDFKNITEYLSFLDNTVKMPWVWSYGFKLKVSIDGTLWVQCFGDKGCETPNTSISSGVLMSEGKTTVKNNRYTVKKGSFLQFYPNGTLDTASLRSEQGLVLIGESNGYIDSRDFLQVFFYPDGKFRGYSQENRIHRNIQGKRILVNGEQMIYPSGKIQSLHLIESATLMTIEGEFEFFQDTTVGFDEDGLIISAAPYAGEYIHKFKKKP